MAGQPEVSTEVAPLAGATTMAVFGPNREHRIPVRGVRKPSSTFVTSAMRGGFKNRLATRSEVLSLIFGGKA